MLKRIVSGIVITLLFIGMLTVALSIQPVKASETIYIRADGSIDPQTAPIERDGDLYTLTGNITSDTDGIVIERNNMTFDGVGYTIRSSFANYGGISLSDRTNVTVINTEIVEFWCGINFEDSSNITLRANEFTNCGLGWLWGSHGNVIEDNVVNNKPLVYLENASDYGISNAGQVVLVSCDNIRVENLDLSTTTFGVQLYETVNSVIVGNNITNNRIGIYLSRSSEHNNVLRNNITDNWGGVEISGSSYNNIERNHIEANKEFGLRNYASSNSIFGNTIAGTNFAGLSLYDCSNCTIVENTISNNGYGIRLQRADYNRIYHNKFVDNTNETYTESGYPNIWDDGYPSGGNFWNDYSDRYPSVVDEYHGASQDVPGSDGIWDSAYEIDADNQDRYPLVEPWSPRKLEGDVNRDGVVDVFDLSIVGQAYGCFSWMPCYNRTADLNYDGVVEGQEVAVVAYHWGETDP